MVDENTIKYKYVVIPNYGTYAYGRDIVPEHRIYEIVES